MEMKVNSETIRTERQSRLWSQEHLARVSGLGLRTIQRIESTGSASYDSIQAIASALEISSQELVEQPERRAQSSSWQLTARRRLAISLFSAIAVTSLFVSRFASADQVLLEVGIDINEEEAAEAKMTTNEGESATIQIDEEYRLLISPTVETTGDVVLSVQLLKFDGEDYVRIAQPRLITPDRELAFIRSGIHEGDTLDISITPIVQ